jgi:two-component system OmpR family response regulator
VPEDRILIVDDDHEIRSLLKDFLRQYGYQVQTAADGQQMFDCLAKHNMDLVILDVMLPGEDGLSLCRRLRSESNTPVIMLTAVGEETDRIVGLEMGADDYMAKPFNPRELLARIKAVLRRLNSAVDEVETGSGDTVISFDGWRLNTSKHQLMSPDSLDVALSAKEYSLLLAFVESPQRVLTRDQLLDTTVQRAAGAFDRSIDMLISRLRGKIEKDAKNPQIIKTVRGGGYLFSPEVKKS